ncbi:hypothetical protein [Brevundimonas goettingensis]|uniref:Lipoprotein n=1 Tax=Brevundimonas goettingensis TaxID=2774190 RepID=A0A975C3Q8_9CAUL|nr:hypothetical protein [Brevundimonas goettingensis]QTC91012.1 hypothetical protein IFJ75_17605 [Brevundimonas goettingensis]
MNRLLAIAALSLLAATASCKRLEKADKAPPAAAPAAAPEVTEALDARTLEGLGFKAAWGAPAPVRRLMPGASRNGAEVIYADGKLVSLGGDQFAFVSQGKLSDAAHIDAGALSIHYLKRTGTGFERLGAWPEFRVDGTFGAPPEWTLRTDLTPAPALLTEAGGVWQGYACSWSGLIELTPEKPVVRVESFPVAYDDSGAKMDERDARAMQATVLPGDKGRSFVVRYAGDRKAEVTYALFGDRYAPTTKPDLLTC